jgi:hypothetical protein
LPGEHLLHLPADGPVEPVVVVDDEEAAGVEVSAQAAGLVGGEQDVAVADEVEQVVGVEPGRPRA